jgi:hypothetical protein
MIDENMVKFPGRSHLLSGESQTSLDAILVIGIPTPYTPFKVRKRGRAEKDQGSGWLNLANLTRAFNLYFQ